MESRRKIDENVLDIHPNLKRLIELQKGLTLEGQATTGQAQASATDQSSSQTNPVSNSASENDPDGDDNYPHFTDSPSPPCGGNTAFTLDDLPNRLNWLLQTSQQTFNVPCPTFDLVTAAAARDATWSALAATFTQKYRPGPFADYVEMGEGDMPIWTVLHDAMRRKDRKIDPAHYYREGLEVGGDDDHDEDEDDEDDDDDDDDEAWLSDGDDPWYKPRN
ncbi:hypothetical protein NpPPO83_00003950 [Neofusicoccum parvum]|uniref:Uncharacterized protein n=1 Tax=Neofusicoccum parvum TaxID=310453 RepID=A0ACB5SAQ8_9PEZI|nr:hypothetical protein NpPPO83_00003950 [Neofusicoccum parvum]